MKSVYYSNIEDIPTYNYFKCITSNTYHALLVKGRYDERKALEHWGDISKQVSSFCDNDQDNEPYFLLQLDYTRALKRVTILGLLIQANAFSFNDPEIIQILTDADIEVIQDAGADYYTSMLYTANAELDYVSGEIKKYYELQKSSGDRKDMARVYKDVAVLEKNLKIKIDIKQVPLIQYLSYVLLLKEEHENLKNTRVKKHE